MFLSVIMYLFLLNGELGNVNATEIKKIFFDGLTFSAIEAIMR